MITKLAIGIESDDLQTQIINEQGQHVCYIELDPHREIAEKIIEAINGKIKKEIVVKVLQAEGKVIYDIQDDGMSVSDIDEKDYIDMIVEEANKVN